jgi:hypothetical protein
MHSARLPDSCGNHGIAISVSRESVKRGSPLYFDGRSLCGNITGACAPTSGKVCAAWTLPDGTPSDEIPSQPNLNHPERHFRWHGPGDTEGMNTGHRWARIISTRECDVGGDGDGEVMDWERGWD